MQYTRIHKNDIPEVLKRLIDSKSIPKETYKQGDYIFIPTQFITDNGIILDDSIKKLEVRKYYKAVDGNSVYLVLKETDYGYECLSASKEAGKVGITLRPILRSACNYYNEITRDSFLGFYSAITDFITAIEL